MIDTASERRAQLKMTMRKHGLNVNSWARLAAINEGTLRAYLAGKTRSLREDTARKLAASIGLTLDQLYGAPSPESATKVWVKGLVGAGAVVQVLDGMGRGEGLYEVSLPPGIRADLDYIAFEIRGFSMPPAQDRWIIYCIERDGFNPDEALGRPCVVELDDGRMLFKTVRRGYTAGRFNLESWDGSPLIEDALIVRALPFASLADPAIVTT
ncbi:hypothetical protein [Maricaulis sp.]|uniref:hypothetical protein n=1 Tax=Maricaulis sp. TaxID=1486257 RepID=UPI003A8DE52E